LAQPVDVRLHLLSVGSRVTRQRQITLEGLHRQRVPAEPLGDDADSERDSRLVGEGLHTRQ
jgi:hypothetical protein